MSRAKIYEVLNGDSKAANTYGKCMTVLIVLSLIPLCFKETNTVLNTIEYICVAIFIVDYICRLITADYKMKRGAISFVLYPFTVMAIIDLVSILPTFIMLNPAFRTTRVLRLFRAVRAFRFIRRSKWANAIAAVFVKQKKPLLIVGGLAIAYVFVTALIVFNIEPNTFDNFFDAVYWATVSLTTVGYGDLYPVSDIGRFIAMISAFVGIALVALPSGIITAGFLEELKEMK